MNPSRRSSKRPANKDLHKYYGQRFRLFSRFDDGIQLDEESWYSVTPEIIAIHTAKRFYRSIDDRHAIIMDGFVGAGGNLIQFACMSPNTTVIGCDTNVQRLCMAKNNARVYGVQNRCQFIAGDFMQIMRSLRPGFLDAVFLSPPWGGVNYQQYDKYSLNFTTPNGYEIIRNCREHLTNNIAFLMPRNVDFDELKKELLSDQYPTFEFEYNQIGNKIKTITAYFGRLVDDDADEETTRSRTSSQSQQSQDEDDYREAHRKVRSPEEPTKGKTFHDEDNNGDATIRCLDGDRPQVEVSRVEPVV